MSDALYQAEILRLAKEGRGNQRLEDADGSARVDNPLCGDRVTVDLKMSDGKVSTVGHRVQGCALCEASAALIKLNAPGRSLSELEKIRQQFLDYLAGTREDNPDWTELDRFAPVRDFKSRHDCVRLPFDATVNALKDALEKNPAF
ncbi:iron-sulfur cluster assembly scaffold protein [Nisaea sp.]|uniref:iron-sulfur cluster assembly scaffold protein n=1 Tax=Nisaea sp. TaxID=2024842 RepID=UPI0032988657